MFYCYLQAKDYLEDAVGMDSEDVYKEQSVEIQGQLSAMKLAHGTTVTLILIMANHHIYCKNIIIYKTIKNSNKYFVR